MYKHKFLAIFHPTHSLFSDHKSKILGAFQEFSGYPNIKEIDILSKKYPDFMPTSRTISRHGGIRYFFENLLDIPFVPASSGEVRSRTAEDINNRANENQGNMTKVLVGMYGKRNVHSQAPYQPSSGLRSDFKVYAGRTFFFMDIFYPRDMHSFEGCVRIKLKKIKDLKIKQPVLFVSYNEDSIKDSGIKDFIEGRKEPIPDNIKIMTKSEAIKYCKENFPQ